jgi:VIT family
MAEKRTTREFLEEIDQGLQAVELPEMNAANTQKRYAIPDLEAQKEKRTDYSDIIRDAIIGFADGLTVPFALTAGLSSYVQALLLSSNQLSPITNRFLGLALPASS